MKFAKNLWELIKETFLTFKKQDPIVFAAAIAFFTLFSLPSVLIIIVQTIGSILGEEEIRKELAKLISQLVGNTTSTNEVIEIIKNRGWENSSPLGNILSILILFISATVIFNFVQKALNSIWNVEPNPKAPLLKFLKDRLISFLAIIALGGLLVVSLTLEAVLSLFKDFLNSVITKDIAPYIFQFVNALVSLIIISIIFSLIFKFLPDAKIKWRAVTVGAIVTGLLFTLGKLGIGIILSNTRIASTYGAAGSLAGLLLWVFYSSVLILLGAAFTRVYATKLGYSIKPESHAKKVAEKKK